MVSKHDVREREREREREKSTSLLVRGGVLRRRSFANIVSDDYRQGHATHVHKVADMIWTCIRIIVLLLRYVPQILYHLCPYGSGPFIAWSRHWPSYW
jgi:hypothetical protein